MVWVMVFSREQLFANSSLYEKENVIIIQTFFSIRHKYLGIGFFI